MINKKYFGKRISYFRRKNNQSQLELAQIIGVSPQAISKWETGVSLPDIECLLALSDLYKVTVNDLLEEHAVMKRLSVMPFEVWNGVHCFVQDHGENSYIDPFEKEMQVGEWIRRNWMDAWIRTGGWNDFGYFQYSKAIERNRLNGIKVGKEIADKGGLILEIGAGPGGGYMPFILQADSNATIIINDLSRVVVVEWKKLLEKEMDTSNLHFASFDFCNIPFADCSIDVVSDHGGIINCIGDKSKALREVYRVLKPGGMFVSLNGFVTKESLFKIPDYARKEILREYSEITEDLYEDTLLAGFSQIDSVVDGVWNTDEGDSDIADLAKQLGTTIEFTQYIRYAFK